MARERILPQHLAHHRAQPVERAPQIGGSAADENAHCRGQTQHARSSTPITSLNLWVAQPGGTRTTWPLRSTISNTAGALSGLGTTASSLHAAAPWARRRPACRVPLRTGTAA